MLMARTEERTWTGGTTGSDGEDQTFAWANTETTHPFYFAGRPVAQLTTPNPELLYLTTDHLGTPVLVTNGGGTATWAGGLEPFGAPWTVGLDRPDPEPTRSGGGIRLATAPALSRLSMEKVFLRYPGQWSSDAFRVGAAQGDVYYNVNRWYQTGTGRYESRDQLGPYGDAHAYAYGRLNPLVLIDPLGDKSRTCCTPIAGGLLSPFKHCFVETDDGSGPPRTYSVHGMGTPSRGWGGPIGCRFRNDGFDQGAIGKPGTQCGDWNENCQTDDCVERAFNSYPAASAYQLLGPNSNSFASRVTSACGLNPPSIAGTWHTPGWGDPVPPPLFLPHPRLVYPLSCSGQR